MAPLVSIVTSKLTHGKPYTDKKGASSSQRSESSNMATSHEDQGFAHGWAHFASIYQGNGRDFTRRRTRSTQQHPARQQNWDPREHYAKNAALFETQWMNEDQVRAYLKTHMPSIYPDNDIELPEHVYARRCELERVLTEVPKGCFADVILTFWAELGGLSSTIDSPVAAIYVNTPGYAVGPGKETAGTDGCPELEMDVDNTLGGRKRGHTLATLANGQGSGKLGGPSSPAKKRKLRTSSTMDTDEEDFDVDKISAPNIFRHHSYPFQPREDEEGLEVRRFNGGYLPEETALASDHGLGFGVDGGNLLAIDKTLAYRFASH